MRPRRRRVSIVCSRRTKSYGDELVLPAHAGVRGGLGGELGGCGVLRCSSKSSPELRTAATCFGHARTRQPNARKNIRISQEGAHGENREKVRDERARGVRQLTGIEENGGGNGDTAAAICGQPRGGISRVFEGKARGGAGLLIGQRGALIWGANHTN